MFKKKNNKGFTLVELVVVISIIGILVVLTMPALFKHIETAKIVELEADIRAIRSAALSYYADNSAYPPEDNKIIKKDDVVTELESQIESLGFPFADKYTLRGDVPRELSLTMSADKISQFGIEKLNKDLGINISKGKTISISIISASN